MHLSISGVKIAGVCACVPSHISYYADELKNFPFPEKSSIKLAKVMGFQEHRISDSKTTLTDMAGYALDYLFKNNFVKKEELDAIIFVAQQADHPVPGNSKIVHGNLKLAKSTHCVDMYENCTGFISACFQASALLNAGLKKVAVLTGEGGACTANKKDRNTYPLAGDASSVTILTKGESTDKIDFAFRHDGTRRKVLITEAGGMRMPHTAETAKLVKDEMGNYRSLENLYMDGTAVFHFVMDEVPEIIDEACSISGIDRSQIDYFLTHQPNKFMLERLADLMEVPREKLFNNIGLYFGNSSCSTIPLDIAFNLGDKLLTDKYKVCLAAFGAGLSLASAVTDLGNLEFCKLLEHPGNGVFEYNP